MEKPQPYVTSTYAQAVTQGCDLLQYKYAGQWARAVITKGVARLYDATGFTLDHIDVSPNVVCILVGDWFSPPRSPTPLFIVWDCWATGEDLPDEPRPFWTETMEYAYRNRLALAKQEVGRLGAPFQMVKSFRVTDAPTLWNTMTEIVPPVTGFILRKSTDDAMKPVSVVRWYKEVPGGLQ